MLPRLSDPAVHAACSFENESLSSPECEQGALLPLQASGPGPKIPEVLVKLPVAYPNFTLYPPGYPFNVYCIYPDIRPSEKKLSISVNLFCQYPWLYIYAWECPCIAPYPDTRADVGSPSASHGKSAVGWRPKYPTLDICPPGYPWNLDNIYPPTTDVSCCGLDVNISRGHSDSCRLDSGTSRTLVTCSSQHSVTDSGSPDVTDGTWLDSTAAGRCLVETTLRKRKTHAELHVAVSPSLKKQPGRDPKSHRELHEKVFEDREVWSPSGSGEILPSSFPNKRTEHPAHPPTTTIPGNLLKRMASGCARSRAAIIPVPRSRERIMTPVVAPPAVPPIYLSGFRSPGLPLPLVLVVSESPSSRSPLHTRPPSSRLSQAMRCIVPCLQKSKPSRTPKTFKSRFFGNGIS